MRHSIVRCVAVLVAGLAAAAIASPTPARAQVPVPGMLDCACLSLAVEALGADLAAKRQAYDGLQGEIGQLDNQLQSERSRMDVNNPADTARFRQLLERRDALFQRSTGPAFSDLSQATNRYGASVQEFNGRCAGRPLDPGLVAQARATRACPPPY
jgi:multidrug resistance efflux pump